MSSAEPPPPSQLASRVPGAAAAMPKLIEWVLRFISCLPGVHAAQGAVTNTALIATVSALPSPSVASSIVMANLSGDGTLPVNEHCTRLAGAANGDSAIRP